MLFRRGSRGLPKSYRPPKTGSDLRHSAEHLQLFTLRVSSRGRRATIAMTSAVVLRDETKRRENMKSPSEEGINIPR